MSTQRVKEQNSNYAQFLKVLEFYQLQGLGTIFYISPVARILVSVDQNFPLCIFGAKAKGMNLCGNWDLENGIYLQKKGYGRINKRIKNKNTVKQKFIKEY